MFIVIATTFTFQTNHLSKLKRDKSVEMKRSIEQHGTKKTADIKLGNKYLKQFQEVQAKKEKESDEKKLNPKLKMKNKLKIKKWGTKFSMNILKSY